MMVEVPVLEVVVGVRTEERREDPAEVDVAGGRVDSDTVFDVERDVDRNVDWDSD